MENATKLNCDVWYKGDSGFQLRAAFADPKDAEAWVMSHVPSERVKYQIDIWNVYGPNLNPVRVEFLD